MVRMFVSAAQTVHREGFLRLCIQQQTDSGIVANCLGRDAQAEQKSGRGWADRWPIENRSNKVNKANRSTMEQDNE